MKQPYSVFTLARSALTHHENWTEAWRTPDPKPAYDVIIIGGGGHGLATAYYLAKEYGITNVAVIEKGWLGGGPAPASSMRTPSRPANRIRWRRPSRSTAS